MTTHHPPYHNFYKDRPRKCCVMYCPAKRVMSFGDIALVGLHHFPRDPALVEKWHAHLGPLRAKVVPRVCSVHFAPEWYNITHRNRVQLLRGAYPTLYVQLTGPLTNVEHLKPAATNQRTVMPIEFAAVPNETDSEVDDDRPLEDVVGATSGEDSTWQRSTVIRVDDSSRPKNIFETVPRKCAIPFCPAKKLVSFEDIKYVGLHHFPKEPRMRSKWLGICGPLRARRTPRICSIHFASEFRKVSDQCRITLLKDAYPSLFVRLKQPDSDAEPMVTDVLESAIESISHTTTAINEDEFFATQIVPPEIVEETIVHTSEREPEAQTKTEQAPAKSKRSANQPDPHNKFHATPRKCCILFCPAKRFVSYENIKYVGLHNFPREPPMRARWHKILGSWSTRLSIPRICSIHFAPQFLSINDRERVVLLMGAYPSRHLLLSRPDDGEAPADVLQPANKLELSDVFDDRDASDADAENEVAAEQPSGHMETGNEATVGDIQVEMLDLLNVCRFCMRNDSPMSREDWFKWPSIEVTQLYQKITGQALPVSEHFSRFWCNNCLVRLRQLNKAIDEFKQSSVFWQNHLEQSHRFPVYERKRTDEAPPLVHMEETLAEAGADTTTDDSSSDMDDTIDALTGRTIKAESPKSEPVAELKCELCGQNFLGKHNLQKHLLRFHKLFQDLYKRDRDVRQRKRLREKYRLRALKLRKKRSKHIIAETKPNVVPLLKYTLCSMCGVIFQQPDQCAVSPKQLCLDCSNKIIDSSHSAQPDIPLSDDNHSLVGDMHELFQ